DSVLLKPASESASRRGSVTPPARRLAGGLETTTHIVYKQPLLVSRIVDTFPSSIDDSAKHPHSEHGQALVSSQGSRQLAYIAQQRQQHPIDRLGNQQRVGHWQDRARINHDKI